MPSVAASRTSTRSPSATRAIARVEASIPASSTRARRAAAAGVAHARDRAADVGLDAVIAKASTVTGAALPDVRRPDGGGPAPAVDSAGPLAETTPPAPTGGSSPTSAARSRHARRRPRPPPRARAAGRDGTPPPARSRASRFGDRVDVREAATLGMALDRRARRPPGPRDPGVEDDGLGRRRRAAQRPADARVQGAAVVEDGDSGDRDVLAVGADERLSAPFSPLQLQVKLRRLLGADAMGA